MKVSMILGSIELDGVRYWRSQDVIEFVTRTMVQCEDDAQMRILSSLVRAMMETAKRPLEK